jgi:hypothetical protein
MQMKIKAPALALSLAMLLIVCSSASAGLVGGLTSTGSTGGATAPVAAFNPFTQSGTNTSTVFSEPNSSSATYSLFDNNAAGAATINWTINNTGADTYNRVTFDLTGDVPSSVAFSAALAPAGFTLQSLSASAAVFTGSFAPSDLASFGLALSLPNSSPFLQTFSLSAHATSVPEPSSLILIGLGAVVGGGWLSQRKKAK